MPGAPRPDRSECPECRAEALGGDRSAAEALSIQSPVKLEHPLTVKETARMADLWEEHEQAKVDDLVQTPGSFAQRAGRWARSGSDGYGGPSVTSETLERLALDRIADLRAEEQERETKRSGRGRLVTGRIENGQWVEFRAIPYQARGRKRERLVRMSP